MRIAINCRSIATAQRTGIGRYTYHLIDHLGKVDQHNSYLLYLRKRLLDTKRRLPLFRYPNFKSGVDIFGRGVRHVDVYHIPSPAGIERHDGKLVVTVHDMIYKTYPQAHTPETVELTARHMEGIVHRARKIICTSEHTRQDLHRFFDVPTERTVTVLNGVDHNTFYHLSDLTAAQQFLNERGIAPGFILFVGTLEPRKNLQGLLQAMAHIKEKGGHVPMLVVVGMKGWMTNDVLPLVDQLHLRDQVMFTGFITDEQLNFLYNACKVFVFPSFYEGFGFPIVEAFCAGAAVVASKTSSCGEIAGDAAVQIDPENPQEMAGAISRLLEDAGFAQTLKQKALQRAKMFSFENTARQTLDVYRGL